MDRILIYNPRSGRGELHLEELLPGDLELELRRTEGPGSAEELAREAREAGCRQLIAVGGDGTINEVVNGLLLEAGSEIGCRLLVVPAGTGNDLARTLAIPLDVSRALALADGGRKREIDVIACQSGDRRRLAANVVSSGFSVAVGRALDGRQKGWGLLSYLQGALTELARLPSQRFQLTFDGESRTMLEQVVGLAVANGRTVGGGVAVAPFANPEDGLLEVVVLHGESLVDLAAASLRQILSGDGGEHESLSTWTCRRLEIQSPEGEVVVHLDGESFRGDVITMEVLEKRLPVVVGPEYSAVVNVREY